MNTSRLLVFVWALGAVGVVSAVATNTLVVGATDWTQAASYTENRVPAAGDVIAFPAGTVYLSSTDTASWQIAAASSLLLPKAEEAILDITVPEGEDATLPPPISASYVKPGANTVSAYYYGTLVKHGAGCLRVTSKGKIFGSKYPTSWYDYTVGFDVQQGTMRMVEGIGATETCTYTVGAIHVEAGTTFYTPSVVSGSSISVAGVYFRGLTGYGDISNDGKGTGRGFGPSANFFPKHQAFHGRLRGGIRYWISLPSGCRMDLLGEGSDHVSSESGVGSGTNGVIKLGNFKGESSLGPGSISFRPDGGGSLLYLGTGETSDRIFYVQGSNSKTNYINAGATGGLRLTGILNQSYGSSYGFPHLVFTGSNRCESVMDGEMTVGTYVGGTNVNCYISKEGSGTWRFTDHRRRFNANGFAVHGGTLAFDSLDDRYRTCALGTASNLLDGVTYTSKFKLDAHKVDYALRAGLLDTSATEAVFEYTGLTNAVCGTRPLVLDGDAHLRNNQTSSLRFAGVSALTTGTKVFTLDGSGTNLNEVADISDGAGQVSVVKDGTGTWVLGGNQTFTGDLTVKGGKLVISKPTDVYYTWYRWSVMEKPADTALNVEELGLYDAAGSNLVQGITVCSNYTALGAGECALGQYNAVAYVSSSSYTGYLENLFSCSVDYGLNARVSKWEVPTAYVLPAPSDPRSWIRVYFRLREDSPRPVSYDFCNVWTKTSSGSYSTIAKRTRLEGSVDGLHWHILNENDQATFGDDSSTWVWTFAGSPIGPANAKVHTGGKTIDTTAMDSFTQFANYAGAVSVAAGATLEVAEGSAFEVKKLALNTAGMGTFKNVSFAASGTVALVALPSESVMVPATFTGCTGIASLGDWSVTVGGVVAAKCHVAVRTNGLAIIRPGTSLFLR